MWEDFQMWVLEPSARSRPLALVADVGGVSVATHGPWPWQCLAPAQLWAFGTGTGKLQVGFQPVPPSPPPLPTCPPRWDWSSLRSDHPWARGGRDQGSGWAFFSVTQTPAVPRVSKHSWVGLAGLRAHPCCVLIRLLKEKAQKNKSKPTETRVPVRGGMWCLPKQRDGEVRGSCFTRNRHSYLGIWGNRTGEGFFFPFPGTLYY